MPDPDTAFRSPASRWKRWSRALHVVLSMFALLFLLFFSVTGFVLHHDDWFGLDDVRKGAARGEVPPALLSGPDRDGIVALLRERHGVDGRVDAFEADAHEIHVVVRKPGRVADAFINRADGAMELKTETGGLLEALTEIHRGEHTGTWGGWWIDIAAVGLALTALSGLVLWLVHPAWRRAGWTALAAGLLVAVVLGWLLAG